MKRSYADIASGFVVLAGFVLAAAMYRVLPDPMPSHFGMDGRPDDFLPKFWGVFLFPLVMLATTLLLAVLPKISPRGFEMERFAGTWKILRLTMLGFLLLIEVLVLDAARSGRPLSNRVVIGAVGLLFVIIGNFLGKVTRNFFAGIRTPWTLANEEVWLRTHRLAGKLFVAAGLLIAASGFLTFTPMLLIGMAGAIGAAALIPVVYSYFVYRKLEQRPRTSA
jgi:uncharacterized membrane protein